MISKQQVDRSDDVDVDVDVVDENDVDDDDQGVGESGCVVIFVGDPLQRRQLMIIFLTIKMMRGFSRDDDENSSCVVIFIGNPL